MTEKEELSYLMGENKSLKQMIVYCQDKLKVNGVRLKTKDEFDQERAEVIELLRSICLEYGDNDWEEDLHICDIISKHIEFERQ